jgi:hypothetical protein
MKHKICDSCKTPSQPAPVQEADTYGYAKRLAEAIWEMHYKTIAVNWKPLPDLIGVLTQIDNMTSGLIAPPGQPAPVQEPQRYSPDGAGGMEVDSLGAYVKHQDRTSPPAAQQKPVASLFSAIQAEPVTLIHKWRVLKLAKEHAAQPPQRKPLTDVMIKKWAERHDIKGVMTDLRCMAEDAETLYLLAEEKNT